MSAGTQPVASKTDEAPASPASLALAARSPFQRWEWACLPGLALLSVLVLVPALDHIPRAFMDECWAEAMAGYSLAHEGRPRNPGLMGWGGADTYFIQPRLFSAVAVAPVYRLAGYGLTQSRATAAAFGFLFIFGVYAAMRCLFGPRTAMAVAAFTAVDPRFFLVARQFRPEPFLAALLWWSLYFLVSGLQRGAGWRAILSGVLLGLAAWTHPNAVVFAIAFFLAATWWVGWSRVWLRTVGRIAVGVALGLLPFVAYVLYVQSVSDVRFLGQLHPERLAAMTRSVGSVLATEWTRWSSFLRLPQRAPLLVLYVLALVVALLRGNRTDRFLVLALVLTAVVTPFVVAVPWPRYLVVVLPLLIALVWRMLPVGRARAAGDAAAASLWSRPWARWGVSGVGLAVLAGMTLAPTVVLGWTQRRADFAAFARPVNEAVPAGSRVMANVMFWSVLYDRQFIASFPPNFECQWPDAESAAAHIRQYRPDYVVQESFLFQTTGVSGAAPTDLRGLAFGRGCEIVAAEVPSEVVLDLRDYYYGAVRIWRLHWPAPPEAERQP